MPKHKPLTAPGWVIGPLGHHLHTSAVTILGSSTSLPTNLTANPTEITEAGPSSAIATNADAGSSAGVGGMFASNESSSLTDSLESLINDPEFPIPDFEGSAGIPTDFLEMYQYINYGQIDGSTSKTDPEYVDASRLRESSPTEQATNQTPPRRPSLKRTRSVETVTPANITTSSETQASDAKRVRLTGSSDPPSSPTNSPLNVVTPPESSSVLSNPLPSLLAAPQIIVQAPGFSYASASNSLPLLEGPESPPRRGKIDKGKQPANKSPTPRISSSPITRQEQQQFRTEPTHSMTAHSSQLPPQFQPPSLEFTNNIMAQEQLQFSQSRSEDSPLQFQAPNSRPEFPTTMTVMHLLEYRCKDPLDQSCENMVFRPSHFCRPCWKIIIEQDLNITEVPAVQMEQNRQGREAR
ncbi:hypothetical protein HD806DRAFT_543404 [Xylariaceae sp. AK1471]|nr:hypothetical protein HD806DRAFT_543404 [Xylariaceae sp. AK1471]